MCVGVYVCAVGGSGFILLAQLHQRLAMAQFFFFFFLRLLFRARTQRQTFTVSAIANIDVVNDTVHTSTVQVGEMTLDNLQDVGRR